MTERIVSIVSIIFAVFFLVVSFQIGGDQFSSIGPATWPLALMILMLLLSIILTINLYRNKDNEILNEKNVKSKSEEDVVEEIMEEDALEFPKRAYYLIITFIFYVIILPYVGFTISTFLLMLILTMLFGMKKWYNKIVTAVISSAAFIFVFPIILNIPFPRGVGIFREISRIFY